MFSRIVALIAMLVLTYGVLIFLTPDFVDTYGDRELNEKIRMWKRISELDRENLSGSLLDQARDIARPYIEDSQSAVRELQSTTTEVRNTIQTKSDQAKDVIEATQKAYNSVEEAKQKIDTLTQFGTGQ